MHYWNLLWDWNSIDSVRSVHSALEGWAIIFFALLVLFDVLAHLSEDEHKKRAKKFERIGLYCFGVAVLTELIAYPYSRRNDELSGTEIRELSAISKQARTDADAATLKAKSAEDEAKAAKIESGNAKGAASAAESLARSARKEAETFERDIASAKADASEAKALLTAVRQLAAEAESRAANAERKVADRHISPAQLDRIHKSLARWNGYDIRLSIVSVNGDGEMWTYGRELVITLGSIPGWSMILTAEGRNNGLSGLSVRIENTASDMERALANDIVAALHDAGVQASGPEPPAPYGARSGGGDSVVSGVFNPQGPKYDPKAAPNKNVAIEIGQKK